MQGQDKAANTNEQIARATAKQIWDNQAFSFYNYSKDPNNRPVYERDVRVQQFIEVANEVAQVNNKDLVLTVVASTELGQSGVVVTMFHKTKSGEKEQQHSVNYVLWMSLNTGNPLWDHNSRADLILPHNSRDNVNHLLSDLKAKQINRFTRPEGMIDIEMHYAGATVVPADFGIGRHGVLQLLGFAVQAIIEVCVGMDDSENPIDVGRIWQTGGYHVTAGSGKSYDVLGNPVRTDIKLEFSTTERIRFEHKRVNKPVATTIFTVGGYIELVPAAARAEPVNTWAPHKVRYVPRFVITDIEHGTNPLPLLFTTMLAVAIVGHYMQRPDWIETFHQSSMGNGLEALAKELAVPMHRVGNEPAHDTIVYLLSHVLLPNTFAVAIDVPVNPVTHFGIAMNPLLDNRRLMAHQMAEYVNQLSQREVMHERDMDGMFYDAGTDLILGRVYPENETDGSDVDVREADSLACRTFPDINSVEMAHDMERMLFPDTGPNEAMRGPMRDTDQPRKRLALQSKVLGKDVHEHNIAMRMNVRPEFFGIIEEAMLRNPLRVQFETKRPRKPVMDSKDYVEFD